MISMVIYYAMISELWLQATLPLHYAQIWSAVSVCLIAKQIAKDFYVAYNRYYFICTFLEIIWYDCSTINSHRMFYFLISLDASNCDIMILFNTIPRNVYYSSTFCILLRSYWIHLCAFGICLCWYVASLYSYVTVWTKTSLVDTCQYVKKCHFENSIWENQPCLGIGLIYLV